MWQNLLTSHARTARGRRELNDGKQNENVTFVSSVCHFIIFKDHWLILFRSTTDNPILGGDVAPFKRQ